MSSPDVLTQAIVKHQAGDLDGAKQLYSALLAQHPQHADALHLLGVAHHQQGDLVHAKLLLEQAIQINPHSALYHNNLGNVLKDSHCLDAAISIYKQALTINPAHWEAYNDLGVAYKNKGDYQEALSCFQTLLDKVPQHVVACNNLGNTYKLMGNTASAKTTYQQALRLQPKHTDLLCNLAMLSMDELDFNLAIDLLKQALMHDPNHIGAIINLGIAMRAVGQWPHALMMYRKSLERKEIKQQNASSVVASEYGMTALGLGNFSLGWKLYENRLIEVNQANYVWATNINPDHSIGKPRWQGESLAQACLYAYAEQGIGDEIMFAQAVLALQRKAKQLIIGCNQRLIPLFRRSFPNITIVDLAEPLATELFNAIDYECPMGSLCQFIYKQLSDYARPAAYLCAAPDKKDFWRAQLADLGEGTKIGISWRGGKQTQDQIRRSIALADWQSLLTQPHCHFINLQYGDHRAEIDAVQKSLNLVLHTWDQIDPLKELDEFSALISALDLVISVDNSTVHLAGSLGVPTWVLLPFYCDWRWLTKGRKSHWYASLEFFRQPAWHSWPKVFAQVKSRLNSAQFNLPK